jgi:ABC-2 type transport system permease protein
MYGLLLPLSVLLGIGYRFIYNIVAFWLVEARAMVVLAASLALFFTGSFIPIPFFPVWLRVLTEWLPFNGLMNLPVEILLGKIAGRAMWLDIGIQAYWCMVLILSARMLTRVATQRVIVQGG